MNIVDVFTPLFIGTLIVLIWSIMYKANNGYRFAEDLTVGVMAGYVLNIGVNQVRNMNINPLLKGDLRALIPISLGILLWTQLLPTPQTRYFSRFSMAVLSGVGVGISLRGYVIAQIIQPLRAVVTPPEPEMMAMFSHAIYGICAALCIIFFFYVIKPTSFGGRWKPFSTLGTMVVYMALGVIGGSMLVSNATFIYDRAQWFVFTPYAWIPLVVGGIVVLVDIIRNMKR